MKSKMILSPQDNPKIDYRILSELRTNLKANKKSKNRRVTCKNTEKSTSYTKAIMKENIMNESSSDSDDYTLNTRRLKRIVFKDKASV